MASDQQARDAMRSADAASERSRAGVRVMRSCSQCIVESVGDKLCHDGDNKLDVSLASVIVVRAVREPQQQESEEQHE